MSSAKPWLEHGLNLECGQHSWRGQPRCSLLVEFDRPREVASWALCNGGIRAGVRAFVCAQVRNADLSPQTNPDALFAQRLAALGPELDATSTVGMMTSAEVSAFQWGSATEGRRVRVWVLSTVGLANALRVGEDMRGDAVTGIRSGLGTINIACWVNAPLAPTAQLEALSIATQARTLEVLEAKVPCGVSGAWASGTGTDCVAVFSPCPGTTSGSSQRYAGLHTALGMALGRATREAVARGIHEWRKRRV